jgi:hypothetical protein
MYFLYMYEKATLKSAEDSLRRGVGKEGEKWRG